MKTEGNSLRFAPLTPDCWPALEKLFGPRGACGGCWCMYWRLPRQTFIGQKGEINRMALRQLVEDNVPTGVLAFSDEIPAGWCAIAPREQLITLTRSRILKPIDDAKVWSINCFFVQKQFRKLGISIELIKAALSFAKDQGAKIIEAYPYDLASHLLPDAFVYTGLASAFKQAGFQEVARRSPTRPIVRYYL